MSRRRTGSSGGSAARSRSARHSGSLAAVLVGVGLLSAVFRFLTNLYSAKAGETLVKTSRDLLYGHIQHLPWAWHSKNPTGDIIQRCTSLTWSASSSSCHGAVRRTVFRISIAMIVLSLTCMALDELEAGSLVAGA